MLSFFQIKKMARLKLRSVCFLSPILLIMLSTTVFLNWKESGKNKSYSVHESTLRKLLELDKSLRKAKLHARGTKTIRNLHLAVHEMNTIFEDVLEMDRTERTFNSPQNGCKLSENKNAYELINPRKDRQEKQHELLPLEEMVSVIINLKEETVKEVEERIEKITGFYKVTVFVAVNANYEYNSERTNVMYIKISSHNDGDIWNTLVENVNTPYVLVANDLLELTSDARLGRLVRELDQSGVAAVSGAVRYPDGHWKTNCYQSVLRNYTLKYIQGYDASFNGCMFCDYTSAPFLTSTNLLRENPFRNLTETTGMFEDWFLRLYMSGKYVLVCPDAMFHCQYKKENKIWTDILNIWNLYQIVTPNGKYVKTDCTNYTNPVAVSFTAHPCWLENHEYLLKTVMRMCEKHDLFFKSNSGTVLGAAKNEMTLPWERDADIHTEKKKLLQYASKKFDNMPLSKIEGSHIWYKNQKLDLKNVDDKGVNLTKVRYNSIWMNVPFNPGWYLRRSYGREIYQHALHYEHLNKSRKLPYLVNTFMECKHPGHYNCLDLYNGDGMMQFMEILP